MDFPKGTFPKRAAAIRLAASIFACCALQACQYAPSDAAGQNVRPTPEKAAPTALKPEPHAAPLPEKYAVLMYHVIDAKGPKSTSIDPADLEAQLGYLQARPEKFAVVDERQALDGVRRLASGEKPKKGLTGVLITVDDGWKNAMKLSDMLAARRLRGTLFMVSSMRNAPCCLSAQELREASSKGLDVENHTHMHQASISRSGGRRLADDIAKANDLIEQATGRKPEYFAYPYGLAPAAARAAVAGMGFKASFGTQAGYWTDPSQNSMVPRWNVSGKSANKLFAQALGIDGIELSALMAMRPGAAAPAQKP